MKIEELIDQAKILIDSSPPDTNGFLTESLEFLRLYAGEKSSFYLQLRDKTKNIPMKDSHDFEFDSQRVQNHIRSCLMAFVRFAEKGLLGGVSIKRQAEIDVANDILSQASLLLNTKGIHPASPCVLIGAVLEEFLRTWLEEKGISLGGLKPSIDTYSKKLYENKLIDKQDMKDITAWGGLRNHAAHGEWEHVSEVNRISIMLEGVNLFMRKHS